MAACLHQCLILDSCGLVGSMLCSCWDFPCVVVSPEVTQPRSTSVAGDWYQEGSAWFLGFSSCCPTWAPSSLCPTIVCLKKGLQVLSLQGAYKVLSKAVLGSH